MAKATRKELSRCLWMAGDPSIISTKTPRTIEVAIPLRTVGSATQTHNYRKPQTAATASIRPTICIKYGCRLRWCATFDEWNYRCRAQLSRKIQLSSLRKSRQSTPTVLPSRCKNWGESRSIIFQDRARGSNLCTACGGKRGLSTNTVVWATSTPGVSTFSANRTPTACASARELSLGIDWSSGRAPSYLT